MGRPGRSAKGHVKLSCYVPPEIKLAIQHEALDRNMTIGEVITEALMRRETIVILK